MKAFYLVVFALLIGSCASINRLTSPVPVDEGVTEMNFGMTMRPEMIRESSGDLLEILFAFEPVFGARTGISARHDIGYRIHGAYVPQLVFDWKHVYLQKGDFYLSGDLAIMGMYLRSIGPQYDILFGKKRIYGTVGCNLDLMGFDSPLTFQAGIGGMNKGANGIGWQINVGALTDYDMDFEGITTRFGIVYNWTPRKFRN